MDRVAVDLSSSDGDRRRMWWAGERVGDVAPWGFRLVHCDHGYGGRGLGVVDGGEMYVTHCESEDHGRALWLGGDVTGFESGVVGWVRMV